MSDDRKSGDKEEVDSTEDEFTLLKWEKHRLKWMLQVYSDDSSNRLKLENKILQKKLQNLLIEFRTLTSNRFGPLEHKQGKAYLAHLDSLIPVED